MLSARNACKGLDGETKTLPKGNKIKQGNDCLDARESNENLRMSL